MHTVETLQQKLEQRAAAQAKREVDDAVDGLPYFEKVTIQIAGEAHVLRNYQVLALLKEEMIERRRRDILETLTRELLDTVNRVGELAAGLDEVASR